ncbi:ATP-dependent nuclease, subunit B [Lacticaseibacillus rhamnosus LOCK900]|nr:ATP-dependent nuclease, subunit B [Lacticaseibacillus rhamnosus LOCK900]
MLAITRSLAQGSACKDLGRNGQSPAITPKAAYTPIPKRASSRSLLKEGMVQWRRNIDKNLTTCSPRIKRPVMITTFLIPMRLVLP